LAPDCHEGGSAITTAITSITRAIRYPSRHLPVLPIHDRPLYSLRLWLRWRGEARCLVEPVPAGEVASATADALTSVRFVVMYLVQNQQPCEHASQGEGESRQRVS
jgi:hypothetical protein